MKTFLINTYFICCRKLWLYSGQLSPDPAWKPLEFRKVLVSI